MNPYPLIASGLVGGVLGYLVKGAVESKNKSVPDPSPKPISIKFPKNKHAYSTRMIAQERAYVVLNQRIDDGVYRSPSARQNLVDDFNWEIRFQEILLANE